MGFVHRVSFTVTVVPFQDVTSFNGDAEFIILLLWQGVKSPRGLPCWHSGKSVDHTVDYTDHSVDP